MTLDQTALAGLTPSRVFDGGDLDCGSGLVLMIRENMLALTPGLILEMRSREPTVGDDLPPWCRMSGHEYLGRLEGEGFTRYFLRRGAGKKARLSEQEALAKDKQAAKEYEWRLRVRATGQQKSTVYCRNFAWDLGQSASFEEKDAHPCAVEALLGALGADLAAGFSGLCSREALELDDLELSLRARLHNVLATLGLEEGDPSFSSIEIKCYASSFADEGKLRAAWQTALARSPLFSTLAKAVNFSNKFAVV